MAIHIPLSILSVWEISHRWHDIDPVESDPQKLPRPVRERIRQLLQALTYGLLPYDVHGEEIFVDELWFTGIRKNKFGRTLDRHLHQGIYDKKFLSTVFILRDEFEKWCWRVNEPLPAFWFQGEVNRWGAVWKDDTPEKVEPKTASAVAKKAAQKRHEPLNQLKQEFCDFWGRGKHQSRAEAARRFYASLPADKKRLLVPSNAERTLTAALSKHLRSKDKG
ncbi:MAG: hypothetical protein Q8K18_18715 [Burkholderiales bacterium]|nr:hypothetical protein [Burkholderiales bacterium]